VLVTLVLAYLALSLAVGLFAATRLRGARDYAVAGGRFGLPVATATVFATWFGAETVLGIPATFLKENLTGLVADPFASVACLVLIGLVFARPIHRLKLLSIGDYFRQRYGRATEVILSLCIVFSYIGWVAAQFVALGLAFNVLSGGAIEMKTGIVIGAVAVLLYTMAGGMLSVALTDFFQAAVIIAGMAYVAWMVAGLAGGVERVVASAAQGGKLAFLPQAEPKAVLAFITSGLVVFLGSVPQQDMFQRVMSAKDEKTAMRASILGGILYFAIAIIPIFLIAAAVLIDPVMVERLIAKDHQLILPTLILERTPLAVQVLFFGALLSAILSTAGGALIAPSVMLAETVLRPLRPGMSERAFVWTMRATVAAVGLAVLAMALASNQSIYQLVNDSGKVVLVAAFVPLAAGLFWKRANAHGAFVSSIAGLATWLILEATAADATVPPALAGLMASAAAMGAGTLLRSR
jgi:solute:Na+ symporter, SSS family